MSFYFKIIIDYEEICCWVEQYDGVLVKVRGIGLDEDLGILCIDFFGGVGEEELEYVDWDVWFEKFDKSYVVFFYQQEKVFGEDSIFFKLVCVDE